MLGIIRNPEVHCRGLLTASACHPIGGVRCNATFDAHRVLNSLGLQMFHLCRRVWVLGQDRPGHRPASLLLPGHRCAQTGENGASEWSLQAHAVKGDGPPYVISGHPLRGDDSGQFRADESKKFPKLLRGHDSGESLLRTPAEHRRLA
jgi:hypothetical protein